MKKYIKIVVIIFIMMMIIIIYNRNRHVSKNTRDEFLMNLDDYNTMAEIYYNEYQKYNTGILTYSDAEDGKIYCYNYSYEIVLNDEDTTSCKNACEAYRRLLGRSTDGANVYDTFVSFGMPDGRRAIVYSAKDKRPSYINHPDDGVKPVIVEKITDHWYYVHDNGIVY